MAKTPRIDITPMIEKAIAQVNKSVEDHVTQNLLRKAFEAGSDYGVAVHSHGYWGGEITEPNFDQWLEDFMDELLGDLRG